MSAARTVIANITLSLDGRTTGPQGPYDMSWIAPHNVSAQARASMLDMTTGSTALLGRVNYQGFGGYWPPVADDERADPSDRRFAAWLDDVEKVVFSRTLSSVEWKNARLAPAGPVETVRALRHEGRGDIWVLSSQSIIRQLLEADEIDRLSLNLAPELVGGGAALFEPGLPRTSWSLAASVPTSSGAIRLFYDRKR
jgi:dihydrofolate reductase